MDEDLDRMQCCYCLFHCSVFPSFHFDLNTVINLRKGAVDLTGAPLIYLPLITVEKRFEGTSAA